MRVSRSGDVTFPLTFTIVVESERELADLHCRLTHLDDNLLDGEFAHLEGRCQRPVWTESEELTEALVAAMEERILELT